MRVQWVLTSLESLGKQEGSSVGVEAVLSLAMCATVLQDKGWCHSSCWQSCGDCSSSDVGEGEGDV